MITPNSAKDEKGILLLQGYIHIIYMVQGVL